MGENKEVWRLKLVFNSILFFILGFGFCLSAVYFVLFFDPTPFIVRMKLQKIPNVKILRVWQSGSEGYALARIEVKNKGVMQFSGWTLTPEQFEEHEGNNIGLSQIGDCTVRVIDGGDRAWIVLEKEVDQSITSVAKAVENYDLILAKVRSLPKYPENSGYPNPSIPGLYSSCSEN